MNKIYIEFKFNSLHCIHHLFNLVVWLPVTHSISNVHSTKVVDIILFEKWTPCTSFWLFRMISSYLSGLNIVTKNFWAHIIIVQHAFVQDNLWIDWVQTILRATLSAILSILPCVLAQVVIWMSLSK